MRNNANTAIESAKNKSKKKLLKIAVVLRRHCYRYLPCRLEILLFFIPVQQVTMSINRLIFDIREDGTLNYSLIAIIKLMFYLIFLL